MKKALFAVWVLVLVVFMAIASVRIASAENIILGLKPGSLNGEIVYSIRHKQFAGEIDVKTEKSFADGWLKGKAFCIPEIGVDKDTEWGVGISLNPLKKWQESESCPALVKNGKFSIGVAGGLIFKTPFKRSQGDVLMTVFGAGWEF